MKIVAVDSDRDALSQLSDLLAAVYPDAEISIFSDPLFAIQYGLNHPVDLVFSEVVMVHTDGFALLEALRKKAPAPRVFFLTNTDRYRERALQCGAAGYLLKPADAGQLRAAAG